MRTIAITSGKGGVGKTNISANLSIALARQRQRVVVFDADIGLANLDVVLGARVTSTLQEVLAGEKALNEVLHQGPCGIRFIPGGSGIDTLFNLTDEQRNRFFSEMTDLARDTDVLVFDTGAGLDGNVMAFLRSADEVLVVVTPDPASLTDGYATAKALYLENQEANVSLVVNMVETEAEAKQVYQHLHGVVNRFLQANLGFAGYVRFDHRAVSFIRKRIPFVVGEPNLPASVDVNRIALRLLGQKVVEQQDAGLMDRLRSAFGLGLKRAA